MRSSHPARGRGCAGSRPSVWAGLLRLFVGSWLLFALTGCGAVPVTTPATVAKSAGAAGAFLDEATAAISRGDLEAAEKAYRSAVAADPQSADAQFGLGNTLMQMDRTPDPELASKLPEAEQAFLAAIRLDPERVAAHANLGVVYYQLGDMEKAAKAFSTALDLDPSDAATTYLLGAVRLQQNDLAGAEQLLLKAGQLDPDLPEAYYGLGVLHRLKGDRQQAIAAFQKYLEIGPGQDPAGMDYARKELEALNAGP